MRKTRAIYSAVIIVLLMIGLYFIACQGGNMPTGLTNVSSIFLGRTGCDGYYCYCEYEFTFTDGQLGEYYYVPELSSLNTGAYVLGKPVLRYNNGGTICCTLTVHYFDALTNEWCRPTVNKYGGLLYGWKPYNLITYASSNDSMFVTSLDSDSCRVHCCTKETTIKDRWYAVAIKELDNIASAKANIRTEWGKLCGGLGSTEAASSSAWVNVINNTVTSPDNPKGVWFQAGLQSFRWPGTSVPDKFMFFEWRGLDASDYDKKIYVPPPDHVTKTYVIETDATGMLTFSFGTADPVTYYSNGWVSNYGKSVSWATEILGWESDMPGVAGFPCAMGSCGYKLSADGSTAPFRVPNWGVPIEVVSENPYEWNISKISGDSIEIWDKIPQP